MKRLFRSAGDGRAARAMLLLIALAGCDLKPPYVILSIRDPNDFAGGAVRIAANTEGQSPERFDLHDKTFPVSITITAAAGQTERRVTVAALDDTDKTVGRGTVSLTFTAGRAGTASVELARPCDQNSECDDGIACNGIETCVGSSGSSLQDGECRRSSPACDDGNEDPNDGCDACRLTSWVPTVVLGSKANASLAEIPGGSLKPALAADRAGNIFVSDPRRHRVLRIDSSENKVSVVAGNGTQGYSGDGGPGANAQLSDPIAIAVDGFGSLFIAEKGNGVVRVVDARTGVISTVAGKPGGPPGDGVLATSVGLHPVSVAVDGSGDVFIGEAELDGNNRPVRTAVRKVDASTGFISTCAGNGTPGFRGDGGDATQASIQIPTHLAIDSEDNLYISDGENYRVRRVPLVQTGQDPPKITTYAGTGSPDFFGDGGPAQSAAIGSTGGMVVAKASDKKGDLYISDTFAYVVRHIEARRQVINTVVGTPRQRGTGGDNGPAAAAQLYEPGDVAVDTAGTLWIMDGYRLRQVKDGMITLRLDLSPGAGDAAAERPPLTTRPILVPIANAGLPSERITADMVVASDGSLLVSTDKLLRYDLVTGEVEEKTGLRSVERMSLAPSGDIYMLEPNQVSRVRPSFEVSKYFDTAPFEDLSVGQNERVYVVVEREVGWIEQGQNMANDIVSDDLLQGASAIAADSFGHIYVAHRGNHRVFRVLADPGAVQHLAFAGNGTDAQGGDGGPALEASLRDPIDVTVDLDGNVFIADLKSLAVRRVDVATGVISTVAGGKYSPGDEISLGPVGDGGPATEALVRPLRLALDPAGNLYILEVDRVRRVEASSGLVTTIIGVVDPADGSLERGLLGRPAALAKDNDVLYVADGTNGRIRSVDVPRNHVGTLSGYPFGFTEDNALARYARLFRDASGIALDRARHQLFVSEREAHVIRRITLSDTGAAVVSTYAGAFGEPGYHEGTLAEARFSGPAGLAFDEDARVLYIADSANHIIRTINVDAAEPRVSTVAGQPRLRGRCCDSVLARQGLLNFPDAIAIAKDGTYYIADTQNSQVRWVDRFGMIFTVLGDGSNSSSGEGAPAKRFPVDQPRGLAVDAFGNLFITSRTTLREVIAGEDGIAKPDDAVRTLYGITNPEQYPEAVTRCLTGISLLDGVSGSPGERLYLLDGCQGLLLELRRMAQ